MVRARPVKTLTVVEVAERFHVRPVTVYSWLQSGEFPGEKHGGRWFIPKSAVDQWEKKREKQERDLEKQLLKEAEKLFPKKKSKGRRKKKATT